MKRYHMKDANFGVAVPDDHGPWVMAIDSEAEIKKARQEGYTEGKMDQAGAQYCNDFGLQMDRARAKERERIAKAVEEWYAYRSILGSPSKESILEVIRGTIPPVGTKLPGGSEIGNLLILPNGGTWERIQ